MPLFKCEKCGCLENTATGNYWIRVNRNGECPLCSECAWGKWHGEFKKQTPEQAGYVELQDGFYGPADGSYGAVKQLI